MKDKIKIMKTQPQVTEGEINAFMDFDTLLKLKIKAEGKRRRHVRNLLIGGGCVMIVTWIMFLLPLGENQQTSLHSHSDETPSFPSSPSTAPLLKVDTSMRGNQEAPGKTKQPESVTTEEIKSKPAPEIVPDAKLPDASIPTVYVQAEPVDGYPALYQYFADNLVYPVTALKDSIQGVVNVVFVIDPSGKAKDITVENSLGTALDNEAIRLVENMPLWKTATYNGKPVQSKISIPITFSFHKSESHP